MATQNPQPKRPAVKKPVTAAPRRSSQDTARRQRR